MSKRGETEIEIEREGRINLRGGGDLRRVFDLILAHLFTSSHPPPISFSRLANHSDGTAVCATHKNECLK
jgi:hypothetical protein